MAEASSDSAQRMCAMPERSKLHLAMIVCQLGFAGNHIIMKIALNMGISLLVFPFYRNIVALAALVPFAYFLEKRDRPPISTSLLLQFFFLGLIGLTCNQEFYYLGLDNTSATFASASENSVPAITFLMAAIFGMEQVHLNRKDGIAKVLGTVSTVAGSLVITLYKGPTLFGSNLQSHQSYFLLSLRNVKVTSWTLGCIYLIGHCLCWSSWIIFQIPLLKKYPARLSIASYAYFFSILQYLVIAVVFERNSQAWIVNSTDELLTIFYTGLVASAMTYAIQIYVIDKAGPLFVSVYLPLQTLLVAIIEAIALGEEFYLGGIIGAIFIVTGLYLVVWGKGEERKLDEEKPSLSENDSNGVSSSNGSIIQPLLATSRN
ncbi:protein WALLS ARE THIN 1-like isoform X1 [Quercus robur]|uniref:protein WALLS ARE THIN 1-like isoform X1 n=1 Tax=Quercus robur TaxID=38942 RepID=UPI0021613518|nr:protein WALLS ARE THIN 1-like isoform X1 [Quercus robur]